ncbi:FMN-linked oxidoreductase [Daldinia loculata]|nr:FMN-linked oxidoreductase [Daldinia loculata]
MSQLLEPVTLGDSIQLRNRVCMGAMTRNRCIDDNKPTSASAKYYADRAQDGAGLIVAEGTFVYYNGAEWPHTPVMFNHDHAAAWKKVTDAVHDVHGKIFFQPWHPGRIQNDNMPMLKKHDYPVYAPSKIPAAGGEYRTLEGCPGHTTNITEIEDPKFIVEQYRNSVTLAKLAGFDGIELLAQGRANNRTDAYGGSVENRCRFPLEVLDAIIDIWGPRQVGIKICPSDHLNDSIMSYAELTETYDYLIPQLVQRRLAFINISRRDCYSGQGHGIHSRPEGFELPENWEPIQQFGRLVKYPGSETMLMVNHEYTVEEAETLLNEGKIDLVTFGRPFIYNPDVITRISQKKPFAVNDRGGFVNYGPYRTVDEFYNDWPRIST